MRSSRWRGGGFLVAIAVLGACGTGSDRTAETAGAVAPTSSTRSPAPVDPPAPSTSADPVAPTTTSALDPERLQLVCGSTPVPPGTPASCTPLWGRAGLLNVDSVEMDMSSRTSADATSLRLVALDDVPPCGTGDPGSITAVVDETPRSVSVVVLTEPAPTTSMPCPAQLVPISVDLQRPSVTASSSMAAPGRGARSPCSGRTSSST